jgi:protein-S-isoprenylcysteine O-methyltransferase Ste14
VAYALAAAVLLLARPRIELYFPGAALCLLGEALRLWGCGHLQKNRRLATTGPYAHLRHPLYAGTVLIVLGLALAAGSLWVVAGVLPLALAITFLYYLPRKERIEADRLERRFGEAFREYRRAVPALLPRLRPWRAGGRDRWRFDRVRENREIASGVSVLAGLAIIGAQFFLEIEVLP